MWLGEYAVGDTLVWAAQTVDTGGSAANAAPNQVAYRIYRDDAGLVANGNMAQHDAQTGFYLATLSMAGWTAGRYSIRMTATVDGEDPAVVYHFRLRDQSVPADVADAVWDEAKADHQGATIMGNIAEDTDNLQTDVEEG